MAYVVTSNCLKCKFTDCVDVCPVDCFYDAGNQLVIDPEECIDCVACVLECPVEAIHSGDRVPEEELAYIEINAELAAKLKAEGKEPLTEMLDPLPTAEARKAELGY